MRPPDSGSLETGDSAESGSRYVLLLPLAEGGMGSVHLAVHRGAAGFSRLVAVKRPRPQALRTAASRESFVREARIAAAVRHVNVAAVLDVEEHGGEVTLVLEYVEGASLADLMRSVRPFPVPVAARILIDAARGLHAAHETRDPGGRPLGIVHRDVSPHNVLVGIDGVARISDFGVAKATRDTASDETHSTTIKGKLAYMAPEYVQNGTCDCRADVFSLGVVAWELFAGSRLFRGGGELEILRRVVAAEIVAPSSVNPSLPAALDGVVLGALARDPDERFPTARAWAHALQDALDGAGISAGPEDVAALVEAAAGPELGRRREALKAALTAPPLPVVEGRSADEATAEIHLPAAETTRAESRADGNAAAPRAGSRSALRWSGRIGVGVLGVVGAALAGWGVVTRSTSTASNLDRSLESTDSGLPRAAADLSAGSSRQGETTPSPGLADASPATPSAEEGGATSVRGQDTRDAPAASPPAAAAGRKRVRKPRTPVAQPDKAPPNPYR